MNKKTSSFSLKDDKTSRSSTPRKKNSNSSGSSTPRKKNSNSSGRSTPRKKNSNSRTSKNNNSNSSGSSTSRNNNSSNNSVINRVDEIMEIPYTPCHKLQYENFQINGEEAVKKITLLKKLNPVYLDVLLKESTTKFDDHIGQCNKIISDKITTYLATNKNSKDLIDDVYTNYSKVLYLINIVKHIISEHGINGFFELTEDHIIQTEIRNNNNYLENEKAIIFLILKQIFKYKKQIKVKDLLKHTHETITNYTKTLRLIIYSDDKSITRSDTDSYKWDNFCIIYQLLSAFQQASDSLFEEEKDEDYYSVESLSYFNFYLDNVKRIIPNDTSKFYKDRPHLNLPLTPRYIITTKKKKNIFSRFIGFAKKQKSYGGISSQKLRNQRRTKQKTKKHH